MFLTKLRGRLNGRTTERSIEVTLASDGVWTEPSMRDGKELRFDGWQLRRDSGELIRGDVRIRLQSQPLAVLEALLARPGEVVSRDDLKSSLWPTGVVDFDTALNSAIRRLRRALGDEADAPRYIETLPRKGYRFIGVLESVADETAAARAVAVPAAAGAVAVAAEGAPSPPTSALPATAVSRGRTLWLALAAAASIAVAALLIAPRFAASPVAAPSVASLAASAAAPVASPAASPVDSPVDSQVSSPAPSVADAEAVDRVARARLFLQRRQPGDLPRARALLEDAIRSHPQYADAYATLASVHWHSVLTEIEPFDAGLERMRVMAERALALDPRSTEAKQRLSNYGYAKRDPRYRGYLEAVLKAAPESALALGTRGFELQQAGRLDEGVEFARRAALAEPLAAAYRYNLAAALYLAGRFDEAGVADREAQELSPRPSEVAAKVMIRQGRLDEALALVSGWPDGPARRQIVALVDIAAGRTREADAATLALIEVARDVDPLRIAEVYGFRGERDQAFEWLERGDRIDDLGPARLHVRVLPWVLKYSPFVAPLRTDPRWQAWAARVS
jgi:DNA-binding winged helix-turn-helix (wHTH) protein/tetratricopeptide (TPR) repeat protein